MRRDQGHHVIHRKFRPRLVDSLKTLTRESLLADLSAGLTVGVLALPLAMAFAIGSGVPPEAGITTAIVAGFLISALGGTRLAVGGPTGAFIVAITAGGRRQERTIQSGSSFASQCELAARFGACYEVMVEGLPVAAPPLVHARVSG